MWACLFQFLFLLYLYFTLFLISLCSFHDAMKHFTLTQPISSLSSTLPTSTSFLSPPHSLLPFQPLVILTNTLITSFNELRSCTPVALGPEVSREIERLMQSTVHDVIEYHRYENTVYITNIEL